MVAGLGSRGSERATVSPTQVLLARRCSWPAKACGLGGARPRRPRAPGELRSPAQEGSDGLSAALRDADWEVRRSAAWALGDLASPTEPILVGLTRALQDGDAEVRGAAAWALARLGTPTPEPVDAAPAPTP